MVASGGLFYYVAHKDRTPGLQLPHDPSKKTLVVLGSGWGATSLLNSLDTDDYNVVSTLEVRVLRIPATASLVCRQPKKLLPVYAAPAKCSD